MPLLVHCPNRCQIRVPSNRMGKVIRCIDCQTPIIIPEVESPLLRTGNWVECRARRAIKKSAIASSSNSVDQTPAPSPSVDAGRSFSVAPSKPSIDSTPDVSLPLHLPQRTARLLRAKPWRTIEPLTEVDPEDILTPIELDDPPSPVGQPTVHLTTSNKPELAKELVHEMDHEDSLVSKLLWYVNPFAKRTRRSA